ncbi:MAG: hypothetical protein KDK54_18145 [Leptospiraceae bacterium]|nr:hypothetical protein [Leptospiraceae bacterium]
MIRLERNYIPYSRSGSVFYFHILPYAERDTIDHTKLVSDTLDLLKRTNTRNIIFSGFRKGEFEWERAKEEYERRGIKSSTYDFDELPVSIEENARDHFLNYATKLEVFNKTIAKRKTLFILPSHISEKVIAFVSSGLFLLDETISVDDIISFLFEDKVFSGRENFRESLELYKNFIYGEYYLTFRSLKHKPEEKLGTVKKLHKNGTAKTFEEVPETNLPPISVSIDTEEGKKDIELNLSSLLSPANSPLPLFTESNPIPFNTTNLEVKEFKPEFVEEKDEVPVPDSSPETTVESEPAHSEVLESPEVSESTPPIETPDSEPSVVSESTESIEPSTHLESPEVGMESPLSPEPETLTQESGQEMTAPEVKEEPKPAAVEPKGEKLVEDLMEMADSFDPDSFLFPDDDIDIEDIFPDTEMKIDSNLLEGNVENLGFESDLVVETEEEFLKEEEKQGELDEDIPSPHLEPDLIETLPDEPGPSKTEETTPSDPEPDLIETLPEEPNPEAPPVLKPPHMTSEKVPVIPTEVDPEDTLIIDLDDRIPDYDVDSDDDDDYLITEQLEIPEPELLIENESIQKVSSNLSDQDLDLRDPDLFLDDVPFPDVLNLDKLIIEEFDPETEFIPAQLPDTGSYDATDVNISSVDTFHRDAAYQPFEDEFNTETEEAIEFSVEPPEEEEEKVSKKPDPPTIIITAERKEEIVRPISKNNIDKFNSINLD